MKQNEDKEDFDEPIKMISSFKNLTKRVNYHDDEIVEQEVDVDDEGEDSYIDMDMSKMRDWVKIKQNEFEKIKEKKNLREI